MCSVGLVGASALLKKVQYYGQKQSLLGKFLLVRCFRFIQYLIIHILLSYSAFFVFWSVSRVRFCCLTNLPLPPLLPAVVAVYAKENSFFFFVVTPYSEGDGLLSTVL